MAAPGKGGSPNPNGQRIQGRSSCRTGCCGWMHAPWRPGSATSRRRTCSTLRAVPSVSVHARCTMHAPTPSPLPPARPVSTSMTEAITRTRVPMHISDVLPCDAVGLREREPIRRGADTASSQPSVFVPGCGDTPAEHLEAAAGVRVANIFVDAGADHPAIRGARVSRTGLAPGWLAGSITLEIRYWSAAPLCGCNRSGASGV